jgi:hypothetical protein
MSFCCPEFNRRFNSYGCIDTYTGSFALLTGFYFGSHVSYFFGGETLYVEATFEGRHNFSSSAMV